MILSFSKKFIFFKPRKTAGTSLEIALRYFCNKNDIITGISREDEKVSFELNGITARPKIWNKPLRKILGLTLEKIPKNISFFNTNFINHTTQETFFNSLLKNEKKLILDNFFKFSIVRNPYDQMRSFYQFKLARKRFSKELSFEHFVKLYSKQFYEYEKKILFYKNNMILNHVIKYEELNEDLKFLEKKLEINNLNLIFKKIKAKGNMYKVDKNIITENSKKIIYKNSKFIFDNFGYSK